MYKEPQKIIFVTTYNAQYVSTAYNYIRKIVKEKSCAYKIKAEVTDLDFRISEDIFSAFIAVLMNALQI